MLNVVRFPFYHHYIQERLLGGSLNSDTATTRYATMAMRKTAIYIVPSLDAILSISAAHKGKVKET